MTITFYPYEEDLQNSNLQEKLDILLEAADRYKAAILDSMTKTTEPTGDSKRLVPREVPHAYNWEEVAKLLREIRELPEANKSHKLSKADKLTKLAEIYEVLRAAKMPKLEAVRLALISEANQLRASSA